jgi:hypothetical protein
MDMFSASAAIDVGIFALETPPLPLARATGAARWRYLGG